MRKEMPVQEKQLNNGLCLRFYDRSNRYFGDFHRAFILVEAALPGYESLPEELQEGAASIPGAVVYRKELERMGVTSEQLAATVSELIDNFLAASGAYLGRSDMPEHLVRKYLAERGRRRNPAIAGRL